MNNLRNQINILTCCFIKVDEQAGNLNFNFINAKHSKLPFSAILEIVSSIEVILNNFLGSQYLDGIFRDELSDDDNQTEEIDYNYVLKIYKKELTRSTKAQHRL